MDEPVRFLFASAVLTTAHFCSRSLLFRQIYHNTFVPVLRIKVMPHFVSRLAETAFMQHRFVEQVKAPEEN